MLKQWPDRLNASGMLGMSELSGHYSLVFVTIRKILIITLCERLRVPPLGLHRLKLFDGLSPIVAFKFCFFVAKISMNNLTDYSCSLFILYQFLSQ